MGVTKEAVLERISVIVEDALEKAERGSWNSQTALVKKAKFYRWLLANSHRYILGFSQLVRRNLNKKFHHFIYKISPGFWRRWFFKPN